MNFSRKLGLVRSKQQSYKYVLRQGKKKKIKEWNLQLVSRSAHQRGEKG